ncbi:MAG: hypothetical protein ACOX6G_09530 [Christensenellales bacterium]
MNKKRIGALLAALFIVVTAFAATYEVTLKSNQQVEKQAEALKTYIEKAGWTDRKKWQEELAEMLKDWEESDQEHVDAMQSSDVTFVWVSRTGNRYHKDSDCSNMKKPIKMTLQEAIDKGRTPCKKCYK